jgi:outer membrane murein-binding lipoprotein Lpp
MQASTIIGTLALILAAALVAGYARSEDLPPAVPEVKTLQKKVDEREAKRRAAVAEQEKRKQEFARRCSKPLKTAEELQECRVAYRQL